MKKIIRLSEQTINQIAAGEVIENPASVIKELIENAIDAKSKTIHIETIGGGLKSIRVSDDGHGMDRENALLSLERHATSKILTVDDLFQLTTLGFRGEALASIAAISQLTLATSLQDEAGFKIEVEGGKILKAEPCARKQGTTVEVRSLFYNVPARKKFQKTAAVCTSEITKLMMSLSLAHPLISFELWHQGREAFNGPCQANHSFQDSLAERIGNLYGKDLFEAMYFVDVKEEGFRLRGWLGAPEQSRLNRSSQYLFVNNRAVFCPMISMAIKETYGTRIASTQHPMFILHLDLLPSLIDVNVHPQKREVRFREEHFIKNRIQQAVHAGLQQLKKASFAFSSELPWEIYRNDLKNRMYDREALQNFLQERETIVREQGLSENGNFEAKPTRPKTDSSSCFGITLNQLGNADIGQKSLRTEKIDSKEISLDLQQISVPIGVYHSYLLMDASTISAAVFDFDQKNHSEGILFVDLRSCYQRVLFESFLSKTDKTSSQKLLISHPFSLTMSESAWLEAHLEDFDEMGISLKQVSPAQFVIESLPSCCDSSDVVKAIAECVAEFGEIPLKKSLDEKKKKRLALSLSSFAQTRKKSFVLQEALGLFEELLKTTSPYQDPNGQPTMIFVSKNEIGRFFVSKRST